MAKETFIRSKPHVNVGAISRPIQDPGSLTIVSTGISSGGNPDEYTSLAFNADAVSTLQTSIVGHSFGDGEFFFDPATSGAATTIDFLVDVRPDLINGTPNIHVTLAILQDEFFVASASGGPTGTLSQWHPIRGSDLRPQDFSAVDGGSELPDFGRPFDFGYAFTAQNSTVELQTQLSLDNFFVEITTVPEPTGVILVLVIGVSVVWSRCWQICKTVGILPS